MIRKLRQPRHAPVPAHARLLALALCSVLIAPAAALAASPKPAARASSASVTTSRTTTTALSTTTSTSSSTTTSTSSSTTTSTSSSTTTSTSSTTTKPPANPKVKPAKATPALYLGQLFFLGADPVTVPGRAVQVTGVVRPYVPDQWIVFKTFSNGRLFKPRPAVQALCTSRVRRLHRSVRSPGVGTVVIIVQHARTTKLAASRRGGGSPRSTRTSSFGSTRPVRRAHPAAARGAALLHPADRRLRRRAPGSALDAYHRLLGRACRSPLDAATITELLNDVGSFHVRFPNQGPHAEGDLTDQLLALINGSKVYWIYPDQLGQALDARRSSATSRSTPGARLPARRDVLLELLLPRLRDPRLRPGARLSRPATAACACRSSMRSRCSTG